MTQESLLASAAVSASYNMLFQLLFRVLTFFLNAFILHFISQDMLGVVNVRLMLLFSTIVFISCEAFRKACLSKTSQSPWQPVINLIWCSLPVGISSAVILSLVWAYVLQQPHRILVPYYHPAVAAYAGSAVIYLLAEPLYITAQLLHYVKLKVFTEGVAIAIRSILNILLIWMYPRAGLINFAIAQIVYACVYTFLMYAYFIYLARSRSAPADFPFKTVGDILPKRQNQEALISWPLASLTWSFLKQSFLKQILTEGERYVMTITGVLGFGDQGIYDVVSNIGALAARFILQPIEESAYFLFSQLLKRGILAKDQRKDVLELASRVLESLMKMVLLIGLTILVFGYAYSFLLLDLYGGSMLSSGSGPRLLRMFCVYVLLLAVNGVSEGFVFSVMSDKEVNGYNRKMLVFSVILLVSSWYFTQLLGSIGFIIANCINMSARITHSIYFIRRYFAGSGWNPLKGTLPSSVNLVSYGAALLITAVSEKIFMKASGWLTRVVHVGIGGSCFLLVMGTLYITEYRLITFIKAQYAKHRAAKDKQKDKTQ